MNIYEFSNYRELIKFKIEQFPHRGHGKMSELSKALNVHSTLISQVLKGHKDLSSDQIILVAKFFGLTNLETDYLSYLLLYNRAGNSSSRNFFEEKLSGVRTQSKNISKRVRKDFELSEEQKAVYYSDWTYAAICQTIALPKIKTVEDVSTFLNLSKEKVVQDLKFLFDVGLVVKENEILMNGVTSLHLSKTSPWIRSHHLNWRQKAIENFSCQGENDLHYSAPLTLSEKDARFLYERFVKAIEEMRSVVDPSPSEKFYCLNIDWFQIGSNRL
jgi:uncharacterized protein (TIGR02147 family)